jgi:hypothetical protein
MPREKCGLGLAEPWARAAVKVLRLSDPVGSPGLRSYSQASHSGEMIVLGADQCWK